MHVGRRSVRRAISVAALVLLGAPAAGCDALDQGPSNGSGLTDSDASAAEQTEAEQPAGPVKVVTAVGPRRGAVSLEQPVEVRATGGAIDSVEVTSEAGPLKGEISDDGSTWTATGRLEPGTTYRVASVVRRTDGEAKRSTSSFSTRPLSLDEQTYPSIAPLADETVGVGMPVIVAFDLPVTDKAAIEKHLSVESTPAQKGAWHWISDSEVHWRPKAYWQPGTEVTVDADVNSIPAGNGIYGQESRTVSFDVGDSVISEVDARSHQMRTFINGKLARTTPITTGKAGFTTRSGIKVIMEKYRTKVMNSETVGIAQGNPEYYNIDDVEYALRVTSSGEFLHAAPWSVGSQGSANVSHGCTGMSTANAQWIYDHSKRGDIVEYTGTDRPMTLTNGYGDWNLPFGQYAQGSALT